jgi:hypothetical protein
VQEKEVARRRKRPSRSPWKKSSHPPGKNSPRSREMKGRGWRARREGGRAREEAVVALAGEEATEEEAARQS